MTFSIFRGQGALDIVDVPAVAPGVAATNVSPVDLVALFGLDRLSADRRLVCRWHRESDGRIACNWEPDIVPDPQR
jgi:hypothetical protein